jgi:hypothetical protein
MNKILKRIVAESEVDEKQQVADGLESLGFEWCTTGGNCTAYYKDLDDNTCMYVTDESGIDVPEKLDQDFMVTIIKNEGTNEETDRLAAFEGYDDFAANYMDMSKYVSVDY